MKTFLFLLITTSFAIASDSAMGSIGDKVSGLLINAVIAVGWIVTILSFFIKIRMTETQERDIQTPSFEIPTLL